jgi:hypothetical protein
MTDDTIPVKQQMVSAAIEQMRAVDEVVELAESERINGGVRDDTLHIMQARVFAYYRAVKRCIDMFPQAEDKWNEQDVDRFEELRSQRREVTRKEPGRGGQQYVEATTAPLDFETLDAVSDQLDDVTAHLAEHTASLDEAVV